MLLAAFSKGVVHAQGALGKEIGHACELCEENLSIRAFAAKLSGRTVAAVGGAQTLERHVHAAWQLISDAQTVCWQMQS